MEDRKRYRIGISQHQPHINADVTPQKYIQRDLSSYRKCRACNSLHFFLCFFVRSIFS
jgi:hypothetical protein